VLIELNEDTGIKNIKKLYLKLKKVLKNESEIILDLKNLRRMDLSLAQLLIAANRESHNKGKKMMLKSVSEDIKKQLYISGFVKN
jgi:anti-anti-sigma factor